MMTAMKGDEEQGCWCFGLNGTELCIRVPYDTVLPNPELKLCGSTLQKF